MARVLVVDDDSGVRRTVAEALEQSGHDVVRAEDGRAALELAAGGSLDLIVSDVYMPEMDGIELLIRLQSEHPGTPMVAMSGGGYMAKGELLGDARGLGAVAVLEKPFTIEQLIAVVDRALGEADGPHARTGAPPTPSSRERDVSDSTNVWELLSRGRDADPAIASPGRPPVTYAGLRSHIRATVAALNERGIGRNDRVAIVLPNGPEMASAFLSVVAGATTAPLNPAYRRQEYEFYLSDLDARTLIVEKGSDSPAVDVAADLGIPVLELVVRDGSPAGTFELVGDGPAGPASRGGMADEDDVALVLHTSGTTSRPKIVPLAQRNICASAGNIRRTLRLTEDDRCMNVMPLFHIHGLMAATLAPLSAGASVFCTPGFNALRFFTWLDEARPTYYTAVPTMHQAILSRARGNQDVLERARLRFVRSSSSSLPPQVMAELEEVFGAPVVEAYAMTEAAHQMTCNPLPPGERKPGTVGVAAGPEVAIMDAVGELLPSGSVGEVVIRGPNVTDGYENNPDANAAAFSNGWFRTGDQGVMDEDGYLTITGRLKEIINRGGEKISPREVDDVLMDHPAIQQVVTFAVPHDKLGEEVAAAVVLREGMEATLHEIREFAATRLADFKCPKKVIILDEIPKGATGKMQRIGLAKKLGIQA